MKGEKKGEKRKKERKDAERQDEDEAMGHKVKKGVGKGQREEER